ncbi:MAG: hypothetical protein WAU91_14280 [Desulfatitalea sp.]
MFTISKGKITIGQLASVWREIIAAKKLSGEVSYRIEKLILRLDVIVDKIFVKTVKAHNILFECEKLTEQFQSELNRPNNELLLLLTRLEMQIDGLVKETHAFRIKAG